MKQKLEKEAAARKNVPMKAISRPAASAPLSSTSTTSSGDHSITNGEKGDFIIDASGEDMVHDNSTKGKSSEINIAAKSSISTLIEAQEPIQKDKKATKRKRKSSSANNGHTGDTLAPSDGLPPVVSKGARTAKKTTDSNKKSGRSKKTPPDESSEVLNGTEVPMSEMQTADELSPSEGNNLSKKSKRPLMNKNKGCVVIDTQVLALECESGRYPTINRFRGTHESLCTLCKMPGGTPLIECDFCSNSVHQLCLDKRMVSAFFETFQLMCKDKLHIIETHNTIFTLAPERPASHYS